MSISYKDILEAKEFLNLPEKASMEEIKSNYRKLIRQWHPDTCQDSEEKCREMTRKIICAYGIIVSYCNDYKYYFTEDLIKQYVSNKDWWFDRFGNDPLWSRKNNE